MGSIIQNDDETNWIESILLFTRALTEKKKKYINIRKEKRERERQEKKPFKNLLIRFK